MVLQFFLYSVKVCPFTYSLLYKHICTYSIYFSFSFSWIKLSFIQLWVMISFYLVVGDTAKK